MQLHRHMAIAEVISRLEQREGIGAAHLHHRLSRRSHLHLNLPIRTGQALAGTQGRTARQLQQQIGSTG